MKRTGFSGCVNYYRRLYKLEYHLVGRINVMYGCFTCFGPILSSVLSFTIQRSHLDLSCCQKTLFLETHATPLTPHFQPSPILILHTVQLLLNSHPWENGYWPLEERGWLLNRDINYRQALIGTLITGHPKGVAF